MGECIFDADRIKKLRRTLWKVVRRISIPLRSPAIVGQDVRRRRNLAMDGQYAACVTLDTPTKGYSILLTTAHRSEADFLSGPRQKYTPPSASRPIPRPHPEPPRRPTAYHLPRYFSQNSLSTRTRYSTSALPAVSTAECIASCASPISTVGTDTCPAEILPSVEPPAISERL